MRFQTRAFGRRGSERGLVGTLISLGAHGAVLLGVTVANRSTSMPPPDSEWGRVIYLAPPELPVSLERRQTAITYLGIDGLGRAPQTPAPPEEGTAGAGGAVDTDRRGVLLTTVGDEASAGVDEDTPIYLASQVQNPAAYDPGSAAPVYPELLRTQQIEGQAVVQFVVDSSGTVDTTSFAVLGATHQEFVVAVRKALPRMRFAPAEQGGLRVRQLVQIPFTFKIQPPVRPISVDSTGFQRS